MPRREKEVGPSVPDKVLYSILVSLLLFGACQFGLVSRDMSILNDRRMDVSAHSQPQQGKGDAG